MTNLTIRRGGIPGPGSDVLEPLVEAAEAAQAAAEAAAEAAADDAAELSDALQAVTRWVTQTAPVVEGSYVRRYNGGETKVVVTNAGFQYARLAVTPGKSVRVFGGSTSSETAPAVWEQSDGKLSAVRPSDGDGTVVLGAIYEAPSDAAFIIVDSSISLEPLIQFEEVYEELATDVTSNLAGYTDADVTEVSGYAQAYTGDIVSSSDYTTLVVTVTPGNKYLVQKQDSGTDELAQAVFLNDNTFVSKFFQGTNRGPVSWPMATVIPPAGCNKMLISGQVGTPLRALEAGTTDNLCDRVTNAEIDLAEVKDSLIGFSPSPAGIDGFYVQAYTGLVLTNENSWYIPAQPVTPGQRLRVSGNYPNSEYAGAVYYKNGVYVSNALQSGGNIAGSDNGSEIIIVPEGVNQVAGSGLKDAPLRIEVEQPQYMAGARITFLDRSLGSADRTIIGFGTSILEGGGSQRSYNFTRVWEEITGGRFINLGKGSSPLRWGMASRRSGGDTVGLTGLGYEAAAYSLTAMDEDKEWFIENYSSGLNIRSILSGTRPTTLSTEEQAIIRGTSMETKLDSVQSLIEDGATVLIEHVFNDTFVSPSSPEYDLLDEPDTRGDRGWFLGASTWFWDRVFRINRYTPGLWLGYYETQLRPTLTEAQQLAAEPYLIPFIDMASSLQWSQQETQDASGEPIPIIINGEEVNQTFLTLNCPDLVHPFMDLSGTSVWNYGRVMARLIASKGRLGNGWGY